MIMALVLGIIVPTAYLLFQSASESSVQILYSQISQIGKSIIDTAEAVFFSGEGAKIVLEVNMPKGITNAEILALIKQKNSIQDLKLMDEDIKDIKVVLIPCAYLTCKSEHEFYLLVNLSNSEIITDFENGKEGKVFVHGELWNAVSKQDIAKGSKVKIVQAQGLTLEVESI